MFSLDFLVEFMVSSSEQENHVNNAPQQKCQKGAPFKRSGWPDGHRSPFMPVYDNNHRCHGCTASPQWYSMCVAETLHTDRETEDWLRVHL